LGGGTSPGGPLTGISAVPQAQLWAWGVAVLLALSGGFWAGYATLARRIRHKFGGIKVY
jgi:hypothetical protein